MNTRSGQALWAVLAFATAACDQGDTTFLAGTDEQRVVYGADDRLEYYAHPDLVLRERTAESVVAMIPPSEMDMSDPDDIQFTSATLGVAWDLCAGQWFASQPTAAMCSGTLIEDDLVLTAGHCVTDAADCAAYRWVFHYYYTAAGTLGPVTSADVFSCAQLVAQEYTATVDYAIIQLDRPATAPFAPAPVKLADTALALNDPLAIIGFPSGIPAKLDSGGQVIDARAGTRDYFIATTDSFGGNSGSGVYDAARDLVGILVRGATDYVQQGGCYVVNVLPANGGGEGEDVTYVHNALDNLCNTLGWQSARLCGGPPGDGWCDACETPADCPAGWSCQTWTGAPSVSFCAQDCSVPADCNAGHHCAAGGFCEPDISTSCWYGDVWAFDSCMNRLWLDTDCAVGEICDQGACVAGPPGDTCTDATVIPGTSQTQTGDLTPYTGDTTGSCAGAGRDRVFEYTLTGQADVTITSTGFDTVLYLRTACPPAGTELLCNDDNNPPGGRGSRLRQNNMPPGTYYLFLDAYGATVGNYTLTLAITYDCQNTCTPGARECSGAGWRACVITGNGCYNWDAVTACGAGETCVGGVCVATCVDGDPCDDGSACTSGDVCASGVCGGTPVVCADGDVCTDDSCTPLTGCLFTPNSAPCSDGDACTSGDACAAGACQPGAPLACSDGDLCTNDGCAPATGCAYTPISCDDGDACTVDTCAPASGCVHTPLACDDSDACNGVETCSPATGCVAGTPLACDDGDACDGVETCEPAAGCQAGLPLACDDGTACTADSCDPATGCVFLAVGCDDGDACTTDGCDDATGCTHAALVCDDGDACTTDSCDPATGCVFTPNTAACDDGDACTQNDACLAGVCQGTPLSCTAPDDCHGAECDPLSGVCAYPVLPELTPCDDGDPCTQDDACLAGGCSGQPLECTAPDACHGAECDPLGGACAYPVLPDLSPCDDGDACTQDDACGDGACGGTPVPCDDGNVCTDDGCDAAAGCSFTDNTLPCDDGNPCTESDACQAGACQGGANTCPCQVDADCAAHEDGDLCNGTLSCQATLCAVDPTTVVTCDTTGDGPCRRSVCAPASGVCAPEDLPDGTACDDGDACTSDDACESGACTGADVPCDDAQPCTADSCEPISGACQHQALEDGAECPDGTCQAGACEPEGDGGSDGSIEPELVNVSGGGCVCGASSSPAGVGLLGLGLALVALLRRKPR